MKTCSKGKSYEDHSSGHRGPGVLFRSKRGVSDLLQKLLRRQVRRVLQGQLQGLLQVSLAPLPGALRLAGRTHPRAALTGPHW